jgi:hypothetical protein
MSTYRKFSSRFTGDKPKTFASFATFTGDIQNFEAGTDTEGTQIETPKIQSASVKVAQVAKVETSEAAVCGELPGRYRKVFLHLQLKPPALIPVERWQRCVEDGQRFLAQWGETAESLGWDSRDLFGLHTPPADPHPSYSRLSRYDATGLVWLLQGRSVIALTETTAAIESPRTGSVLTYRKANKPALGPVGDSLEDLK